MTDMEDIRVTTIICAIVCVACVYALCKAMRGRVRIGDGGTMMALAAAVIQKPPRKSSSGRSDTLDSAADDEETNPGLEVGEPGQRGQGIVLDSLQPAPGSFWKRCRLFLMGCLLFASGFGSSLVLTHEGYLSEESYRHYRREIILAVWGRPYRDECERYELEPPLNMVFASNVMKSIWIEQHKSSKGAEENPIVDEPNGFSDGWLDIDLEVPKAVQEYLEGKGYMLALSGKVIGEREVHLPGNIRIPAGRHSLHLSLPGCKPMSPVEVDLKAGMTQALHLVAEPMDGVVAVNCNRPEFEVWQNDGWRRVSEMSVPTLREIDVAVRAAGCRCRIQPVRLEPGERRDLNVVLNPCNAGQTETEAMKLADEAYRGKGYDKARKLYEAEAGEGNGRAHYRLGEMDENGYS